MGDYSESDMRAAFAYAAAESLRREQEREKTLQNNALSGANKEVEAACPNPRYSLEQITQAAREAGIQPKLVQDYLERQFDPKKHRELLEKIEHEVSLQSSISDMAEYRVNTLAKIIIATKDEAKQYGLVWKKPLMLTDVVSSLRNDFAKPFDSFKDHYSYMRGLTISSEYMAGLDTTKFHELWLPYDLEERINKKFFGFNKEKIKKTHAGSVRTVAKPHKLTTSIEFRATKPQFMEFYANVKEKLEQIENIEEVSALRMYAKYTI